MAKLTEEQKLFIIQRLACFDTPDQVSKAVKEEYGIEVRRMHCETYDPNKVAGRHLSEKYRRVFEETRAKFLAKLDDIPIANKAYRMRVLDRMARKAEDKGNAVLTGAFLEQAAKEMGEAYTNRQKLEHTSPDGTMTPVPLVDRSVVALLVDKLTS